MNTLESSLYAAAIICCLLCAFVAGSRRAPRRFTFLVVYFGLESLRYVFQWLMVQPTSPAKALWLGSLMVSSFLVAPALWMFAREIAERRTPSLRSLRGWHLGVILMGALLTVPLLLRTHLGTDYVDPRDVASPSHSLFIHTTMIVAVILFLCQVPYYLTASVRLLGASAEADSIGMLRLLIFIACSNWLVGLLRVSHLGVGIVFCVLEVGVTAVVVFALMRRATVFKLEEREVADEGKKYARSALDAPARLRIRRKLADAMNKGGLHRDCRVTLRSLCEALKENPHYVSQVINQDLATSFYDLIKKHRVEDAMAALVSERERTVLDIALAVGFNSKSAFNAAFRQLAGMTPRQYRKQGKGRDVLKEGSLMR
jgi:AraC-like DNA-binding protein